MNTALIELQTAVEIADEVSVMGLSITLLATKEGISVKGKLTHANRASMHHEHRLSWAQLHDGPGLLSHIVKCVEATLRGPAGRSEANQ